MVTALETGTTYTFAVRARNGAGPGPAAEVDATPRDMTPPAFVAAETSEDGRAVFGRWNEALDRAHCAIGRIGRQAADRRSG